MTTEQIIVLGLLAVAYVGGWVMGAVTARLRSRRHTPPFPTANGVEKETLVPGRSLIPVSLPQPVHLPVPEESASVVFAAREQLDHAIKAYHAAVAVALSHSNGAGRDDEAALRTLAHSLVELARATGEASERLERSHPLAEMLRQAGPELVELAADVMARSKERRLPAAVLDRLEQDLTSAAAAILGSGGAARAAA